MAKYSFIVLIISIIVFSGCKEKNVKKGNFTVEGEFTNLVDSTIVLYEKTNKGLIAVDSAKINKNKFELKGTAKTKNFYVVQISKDDFITLVADSGMTIKISGDGNNVIKSYKVSGSEQSEQIMQLEHKLYSTLYTIDSLGKIYKKYFKQNRQDLIKPHLDSIFFNTVNSQKEFSVKFIEQHAGSLASLVCIAQQIAPLQKIFDPASDYKYYYMVDSALMAKYPENEHVKKFHNYVINLRKRLDNNLPPPGKIGVGVQAPDFEIKNQVGDTIRLSDFRGKYVILSFWASWCNPCKISNKELNKYYWKYYHKFDVIQISMDQNKNDWEKAIKQQRLNWFHGCDFKVWQSDIVKEYQITKLPSNFLISPDGKIIGVNLFNEKLGEKLKEIFP